jgi:aminoglycoside phosphotransferase (APT) family kinase protein
VNGSSENIGPDDTTSPLGNLQMLGLYLEGHIDEFNGLLHARAFTDGQSNPTYLITAKSGQYVLRRKPVGILLKSAHAVEREYEVMKALVTTDVPVPGMLHLCEDDTVIGSAFFVMQFIEGRTFWNPALPDLNAAGRTACYDEMNRTLAAIHAVDITSVGLAGFGKPGNYFERQVARWTTQYRNSETETVPAMEAVIGWLEVNMLSDDGRVALVHGDFRIDNLMFSKTGFNVLATLDWELSTLGHPFADLAYQCAIWRMQPDAALRGLKGIDRGSAGIPEDQAYIDAYCQRRGIGGIDNWSFYVTFGLFRIAAIVQGVKKRALDGNAASPYAKAIGGLVEPLAIEAASVAGI